MWINFRRRAQPKDMGDPVKSDKAAGEQLRARAWHLWKRSEAYRNISEDGHIKKRGVAALRNQNCNGLAVSQASSFGKPYNIRKTHAQGCSDGMLLYKCWRSCTSVYVSACCMHGMSPGCCMFTQQLPDTSGCGCSASSLQLPCCAAAEKGLRC